MWCICTVQCVRSLYYTTYVYFFSGVWKYLTGYKIEATPMSPTECTHFIIQLCLRSPIGLWEKILLHTTWYHALFFFWCGFTIIVVWSTEQVLSTEDDATWWEIIRQNCFDTYVHLLYMTYYQYRMTIHVYFDKWGIILMIQLLQIVADYNLLKHMYNADVEHFTSHDFLNMSTICSKI